MYIDSFTVAALVVFITMLAVIVRFCMVKVCGMIDACYQHGQDDATGSGAS